MSYQSGFEHYLFLKILALSIPKGAEHICEDTHRRKQWLKDYPHLLTGAMLLVSFSYAEGILGKKWIEKHGNDFKEELNSLRIIRNAITHNDGNIKRNITARKLTGEQQFDYVKSFVQKLTENKYHPLTKCSEDKRRSYIYLEDAGVVKLGKSSYGRIGAIINNVFLRACVIKYDR